MATDMTIGRSLRTTLLNPFYNRESIREQRRNDGTKLTTQAVNIYGVLQFINYSFVYTINLGLKLIFERIFCIEGGVLFSLG